MNLDPGAVDHLLNDDGSYWCEATSTFGDGDLGTPGADNDSCGVPSPDADGDGYTVADGDCDDGDPAVNPGASEVCNGFDDDCDGIIDEGFDADGDGVTTCAGD